MLRTLSRTLVLSSLLWVCAGNAWAAKAPENPLKVKVSVVGGFDDNTALNSERKEDGLMQETASVLYKRLLNAKSQIRLSYNALNANYFDATDQNIFSNQVSGGLSLLLAPGTIWENDYTFQYLDFTRNEAVTQYVHSFRTGLRKKISSKLSAAAGWTLSERQFTDKKTRSGDGVLSVDDERTDGRHILDARLDYKLNSKVVLNGGGVIYWNDSDDLFHDYYDYVSYKLFGGVSWRLAAKWVSFFKLSYERREYDSRPRAGRMDDEQEDDAYVANASLFYNVDKHLAIGSTYTYRQKNSNEPSQEYSGALGTLGLYYNF